MASGRQLPDGRGRPGPGQRLHGQTLFTERGAATLTIPTALNEAKGAWKVKVADLGSGVVGEATFEVK